MPLATTKFLENKSPPSRTRRPPRKEKKDRCQSIHKRGVSAAKKKGKSIRGRGGRRVRGSQMGPSCN